MSSDPTLLGEFTWNMSELAQSYPPLWTNRNKERIAQLVGDDRETGGTITASRWALPDTATLPPHVQPCSNVRLRRGFFTYEDATTSQWYMNFADPVLFGYGEGPLLAQDELQIVEHPILCSLAKAIGAGEHGQAGLTRSTVATTPHRRRNATPVLVQGAPRRCRLDTRNIYGDAFLRARPRVVEQAVGVLPLPHNRHNLVAVAAVRPHSGGYTQDQILEVYETAYTAFRAVVLRQQQSTTGSAAVTIHTGHWGCGAFGGNKGLVAALQILAAGAAQVDKLVYWYGTTVLDQTAVKHGQKVAAVLQGRELSEALQLLDAAGYRWGDANENHVPYTPPDNDLIQLLQNGMNGGDAVDDNNMEL